MGDRERRDPAAAPPSSPFFFSPRNGAHFGERGEISFRAGKVAQFGGAWPRQAGN